MSDPLPDPAALVLSQLSELQAIPEDEWMAGPVSELGLRLHRIRVLQSVLRDLAAEIEESVAASMETDIVTLPGVGRLIRASTVRSTWRDDGASERLRDDLARAVARDVALDVATGELNEMKRNVAMHTMRTAYEAIPSFSSLKQAARRRLGLQIGEYRQFDNALTVKIEESE